MYIFLISIFLSLNLFANTDFFSDDIPLEKPKEQKIVLLTFDDGPIKATKNVLKVIKKEDIPITMFFIGSQIEKSKHIYEKALNFSNITIANHTYSHANHKYKKFYSNPLNVVEDIKKANDIISHDRISNSASDFLPVRLAGRNVFRLPDIKINDYAISKEQQEKEMSVYDDLFNEGFYIYGWDIEWEYEFNGQPIQTPEEVLNSMERIYKSKLTTKENKVILLMHDIMFSSHFEGEKNLNTLITLLKNHGWSFESIENY
ncbi:polysaccharide deacetylase family protein [Aliarcobacter lanthieri]|uniref:polysaccharide deacetylase family protein n=1 Tax=Aliarcobacter lanthieri TaxID=1355374 RepID=UPI003AAD18FD